MDKKEKNILWFSEIEYTDTGLVGGKNASLGEMYSKLRIKGVNIPNGFVLTSKSYWYFLKANKIDEKLKQVFSEFDPKSIQSLKEIGKAARDLILNADFPEDLKQEVFGAYKKLSAETGEEKQGAVVAIRSSATAEDLKGASFAGAMETYLNIQGDKNVLSAIKKCISSLFTDRAIAYREEKGFKHLEIALSACVLQMVRSDLDSSGIMFTLDTESGFRNVVLINSIYGVGELIVKGRITPDEFILFKPSLESGVYPIIVKNLGRKNKKYVYRKKGGLKEVDVPKESQAKFSLSDEDAITLAKWAVIIENHYQNPQDIEWAKDGKTGELFIVQSRPETVHAIKEGAVFEEYEIEQGKKPLLEGIAIGSKIGQGKTRLIKNVVNLGEFQQGDVLVTKMTDPDWVPIMRMASAIITEEGSRVCHAAIVSRELGVPCIVGTGNATKILKPGQEVTVDCSSGVRGRVFNGILAFEIKKYDFSQLPQLPVKIMINIGTPELAFKSSFLPVEGVGLARQEFIIAEKIRIHPLALYHYNELKQEARNLESEIQKKYQLSNIQFKKIIQQIDDLTIEYEDRQEFFVKELAEGISQIAAAFYPKPVIVRLSDLKTNEYRALIGGNLFEPEEENPMLGFRGASRYYDEKYKPAFLMELKAIKRARDFFGLKNIKAMVPFCRTLEEGRKVVEIMESQGLERGKDGLEIYVMCEIPSNVELAREFLEIFDGMSIGSNDLTQLSLGIDRDNSNLVSIGDERDEAVKRMIKRVIEACLEKNKYCGICGDAPSSLPDFANFLLENRIPSMSLSPDVVVKTILALAKT